MQRVSLRFHKKGLSDVITAVLLILVALGAVVIIWNFLKPTLVNAGEQIQTGVTTVNLEIPAQYVKYDSLGNSDYITLNVQRKSGKGDLVGFNIVVEDSSGKKITLRQDLSLAELESKIVTVNGSGLTNIIKISAAPILKSQSGKEFLGDIQSTTTVNSPDPGKSLINSSTWKVGVSGGQIGFSANGGANENIIELGIGPFGNTVPLWNGGNDAISDGDGGWNTNSIAIDPTKTYRFSVWIKKTGSNDGSTYLGANGGITYLNGVVEGNPYFYVGDLPSLDKWYLVTGYVHPYTYSGVNIGGVYDKATKQKVISYAGNSNGNADFKFTQSSSVQTHRAYLYYDVTTTDRQYFYGPRIDVIDGTEPTIEQLLG